MAVIIKEGKVVVDGREVKQDHPSTLTGAKKPKTYKGKSIDDVVKEKAKAKTKQDQPTTREEIITSLMQRQGKNVEVTKEGDIVATKDRQKVTITRYGDIITTPASAKVRPEFVPGWRRSKEFKAKQAKKKEPVVYVGVAETDYYGRRQNVAVPAAGADARVMSQKEYFRSLTPQKRAEVLNSMLGYGAINGHNIKASSRNTSSNYSVRSNSISGGLSKKIPQAQEDEGQVLGGFLDDYSKTCSKDNICYNSNSIFRTDRKQKITEKDSEFIQENKRFGEKGFFSQLGKEYFGFVSSAALSVGKGFGKLMYHPNYYPSDRPWYEDDPLSKFKPIRALREKTHSLLYTGGKPLYKDTDVQRAGIFGGISIVSSSATGGEIIKWGRRAGAGYFATQFIKEPTSKTAAKATILLTPDIVKGGLQTAQFAKSMAYTIGAEKIPESEIFADTHGLPVSGDTKHVINMFRQGETPEGTIVVGTASPAKLSGLVAGMGRKGAVGLEDPGIYVTPKGQGSGYFLRLMDQKPDTEYTLNPLKGLGQYFKSPTVTEFEAQGVQTLPRSVAEAPGFSAISHFFAQKASKEATAYITKRSQLGRGEIQRQEFTAKQEFLTPIPVTVRRGQDIMKISEGGKVLPGDILRESGTTEIEAVIPAGSQFVYKPGRQYTTYKNRIIPVRRATLLSDSLKHHYVKTGQAIMTPEGDMQFMDKRSVSGYQSDYHISTKRYVTPYPALSMASVIGRPSSRSAIASRPDSNLINYDMPSRPRRNIPVAHPYTPVTYSRPSQSLLWGRSYPRRPRSKRTDTGLITDPFYPSFPGTPPGDMMSRSLGLPRPAGRSPKKRRYPDVPLVSFKPQYVPSMEALAFGIRGKKPSKRSIGMGLGLRPVVL